MEGKINVTYTLICDKDTHKEITIEEIISNEKLVRLLKSEFAKGIRNLEVSSRGDAKVILKTEKELYSFVVDKQDFADLVELAEEDARLNKRLKKDCQVVKIMDFVTID
jgi:siroheme synthase (precorrin-2 oxidase/ferrochelatase)